MCGWVGWSSNFRQKMNKLMEKFAQDPLAMLQIHGVRWLSRETSHEANGTMQPQLMNGSPIGQGYTNLGPTSASNPF